VMDAFYRFCHLAGPDKCAYYEKSPQDIESRLDILLAAVRKEPVVVPSLSPGGMPEIISYFDVRRMQSRALYQPLLLFPSLAEALAGLEHRDGRAFIKLTGPQFQDLFTCGTPDIPTPEDPELLESTADASTAIMCSDGSILYDTVDSLQDYVNVLLNMSKAAGGTLASFKLACIGWSIEAKWRFTGEYWPFLLTRRFQGLTITLGPFAGNTSSPILFIANEADGITPLRSAVQNARGFQDSVILVQNSYGVSSSAVYQKGQSLARV
jgi:hypothetical protein